VAPTDPHVRNRSPDRLHADKSTLSFPDGEI
jgi:hypothetical protein